MLVWANIKCWYIFCRLDTPKSRTTLTMNEPCINPDRDRDPTHMRPSRWRWSKTACVLVRAHCGHRVPRCSSDIRVGCWMFWSNDMASDPAWTNPLVEPNPALGVLFPIVTRPTRDQRTWRFPGPSSVSTHTDCSGPNAFLVYLVVEGRSDP